MGLLTKEVEVGLSPNIIKHYESLGYYIPKEINIKGNYIFKSGTKILVKVEDLTKGSYVKVDIECDKCGKKLENIIWKNYIKYVKDNGEYFCNKCAVIHAMVLYGTDNTMKTKLKKGKSFAQWGIDNIDNDFLDKYWDWEKNNELNINPWEINHSSGKKIYIKCQEKDYHGSYFKRAIDFVNNTRCPYCCNFHGKVHKLDSLGSLHPETLIIWSDKNQKSPYEYASYSKHEVYWKCHNKLHKDYKRKISVSTTYDFRCPECQRSKGEEAVSDYLTNKSFVKIDQDDFKQLIDKYNKNYYTPQKEFNGLVGLGNGLLSYDFYLPQYNILIEYQGRQHEKYIPGFHETYEDFEKQVEHDRRKKEYAENNNIKLLEIWYWDFDKIEEILTRELNNLI